MTCQPPRGTNIVAFAELKLREGSLAVASNCLARAVESAPADGHIAYLRGGVQSLGGDARGAIQLFHQAVSLAPRHANAYFELGNAHYGLNELPAAEQAFRSSLAMAPRQPLCYMNLGNLYSTQRRNKRAERNYRAALAISPAGWNGCASSNGLTNLLELNSRWAEAEHTAEAALLHSTSCHYAAHNLARLRRRDGRLAEAVSLARRALASAPSQPEYSTGLGAALHTAGMLPEACAIYRRVLAASPSDHRLRVDLANALSAQVGAEVEAVDAYAAALPLQLRAAAAMRAAEGTAAMTLATAQEGEQMAARTAGGVASARRPLRGLQPLRGRVVFYCRLRAHAGADAVDEDVWGPTTLATKGLGGSEEAVIFISRELSRRGWEVVVYANPPAVDAGAADSSGVVWRAWYTLEAFESRGDAVDVLVSWRNIEGATLLPACRSRYVWLQDIVDVPAAYHPRLVEQLSGDRRWANPASEPRKPSSSLPEPLMRSPRSEGPW